MEGTIQHVCDCCDEPEDKQRPLQLCRDCGIMEYCSKNCQVIHWRTHKPGHKKAVAEIKEKKRVAATEAVDFPVEPYIQYVDASWNGRPEVRSLLINILKAYTERKREGLLICCTKTKKALPGGNYYPLRFIGNGDHPHSEAHYTTTEVPAIEVEHCMGCKSESRAAIFLADYEYETMDLDRELYNSFRSEVMNRGFWLRVDGEKQYCLSARNYLSRGHISAVQWDGTMNIFNSEGKLTGIGGNVYDKSKIDQKYVGGTGVEGLRFAPSDPGKIEETARMVCDEVMGSSSGTGATKVTPQKLNDTQ